MAILTNTLVTLRQGLMNYFERDNWYTGTTSASAAATAKQMADSVGLLRFQDDTWNTKWNLFTSGSNSANSVKVSDFAQSTGVVTFLSAFSAAIAASVTYELLPYNPATITWALNQALLEVNDKLYRSILNEDLITGNALPNSDFEDWTSSTVPNHWALSVATAAKNTSITKYSRASAAITGGATPGYMGCEAMTGASTVWLPLLDLAGYTIDFEAWVKTDTASHGRLQIVDSGGTTSSSYHTGGSLWELLKVTRTITSGATSIAFRVTADVNAKVTYVDHARAMNGPISEYVLPGEFVNGKVEKVWIQRGSAELSTNERPCDDQGWLLPPTEWVKPLIRYDDRLGVWLMSLADKPPSGYKMRMEGREPQNTLSADTDTVALSTVHLTLLYPYAAYLLLKAFGRHSEAEIHKKKYDDLKALNAMPAMPHSAIYKWGRW